MGLLSACSSAVDGMQDYKLRDEIKLLYLGLSVSCVLVSVKGEE
jgi:hypothetical protein